MLSQEELGARLRLSERQIRILTSRGMPREAPKGGRDRFGRYPWPACLFWYLEHKGREAIQRAERYETRGPNTPRTKPKLRRVDFNRFLVIPLEEALELFAASEAAKSWRRRFGGATGDSEP